MCTDRTAILGVEVGGVGHQSAQAVHIVSLSHELCLPHLHDKNICEEEVRKTRTMGRANVERNMQHPNTKPASSSRQEVNAKETESTWNSRNERRQQRPAGKESGLSNASKEKKTVRAIRPMIRQAHKKQERKRERERERWTREIATDRQTV